MVYAGDHKPRAPDIRSTVVDNTWVIAVADTPRSPDKDSTVVDNTWVIAVADTPRSPHKDSTVVDNTGVSAVAEHPGVLKNARLLESTLCVVITTW